MSLLNERPVEFVLTLLIIPLVVSLVANSISRRWERRKERKKLRVTAHPPIHLGGIFGETEPLRTRLGEALENLSLLDIDVRSLGGTISAGEGTGKAIKIDFGGADVVSASLLKSDPAACAPGLGRHEKFITLEPSELRGGDTIRLRVCLNNYRGEIRAMANIGGVEPVEVEDLGKPHLGRDLSSSLELLPFLFVNTFMFFCFGLALMIVRTYSVWYFLCLGGMGLTTTLLPFIYSKEQRRMALRSHAALWLITSAFYFLTHVLTKLEPVIMAAAQGKG